MLLVYSVLLRILKLILNITVRFIIEDHLSKLRQVLVRLRDANLKVNANKSSYAQDSVEYIEYILGENGIKPVPEKISAILAIKPPTSVKELRRFLGMVQFYRDMWQRRSHILAPLTDLVGEGKKKLAWNDIHQKAFNEMKKVISKETSDDYRT